MATRRRKEFGNYIVSDPKICGGDFTFKGTRVLVKDVLYYAGQAKDLELDCLGLPEQHHSGGNWRSNQSCQPCAHHQK